MLISETGEMMTNATVVKAEKLFQLLEEAQLIANELVANDELKVLKEDDVNIDYLLMRFKYKVLDYCSQET